MPRLAPAIVLALAACDHPAPPAPPATAAPLPCALPAPTELKREGEAVLVRWDLVDDGRWLGAALPDAPGYRTYRDTIIAAGGDLARPVQDPPAPKDDREREVWRREDLNTERAHGGGHVHPVRCLEAALFAYQDARFSELTHPTELIASIVRQGDQIRIYAGGSGEMFPRGAYYGTEEARADVAAGWTFWTVFHNHTVKTLAGKPALGSPAPSTNDVQLFQALVAEDGLQEIWVTNGMYTAVIPGSELAGFATPPPVEP